jgi:hypothetical protein
MKQRTYKAVIKQKPYTKLDHERYLNEQLAQADFAATYQEYKYMYPERPSLLQDIMEKKRLGTAIRRLDTIRFEISYAEEQRRRERETRMPKIFL